AALNQTNAVQEMREAANYLRAQGAPKVASLGWCFGGKQSLELALSGEPLSATVIYYGSNPPTSPHGLEVITWPLLALYGDQDQGIPLEHIEQFKAALAAAGVAHSIQVYPGVGHAFANPSGPNYAPEPTADAWAKTLDFLAKNLK
ncbi:MAG: dienelactone hydrolase family protein, partial [Patescibacteria group bacterium]